MWNRCHRHVKYSIWHVTSKKNIMSFLFRHPRGCLVSRSRKPSVAVHHVLLNAAMTFIGRAARRADAEGKTSEQICTPIIPDSWDAWGFVSEGGGKKRKEKKGITQSIRSANPASSVAAALPSVCLERLPYFTNLSYLATVCLQASVKVITYIYIYFFLKGGRQETVAYGCCKKSELSRGSALEACQRRLSLQHPLLSGSCLSSLQISHLAFGLLVSLQLDRC